MTNTTYGSATAIEDTETAVAAVDAASAGNDDGGSGVNIPLPIHVVSADLPDELLGRPSSENADNDGESTNGDKVNNTNTYDEKLDELDKYNTPRLRRNTIVSSFLKDYSKLTFLHLLSSTSNHMGPTATNNNRDSSGKIDLLKLYSCVHDPPMIEFLLTAWSKWVALGQEKGEHYEECCHPAWIKAKESKEAAKNADSNGTTNGRGKEKSEAEITFPPLIPCHSSFRNPSNFGNKNNFERPSKNVMGAMGYYCTDLQTPVVSTLVEELEGDARVILVAVDKAMGESSQSHNDNGGGLAYAVTTHPGHHASKDNFGGYCYLNNAALCAKLLQDRLKGTNMSDGEPCNKKQKAEKGQTPRVAILDVDYHCGNGTAAIFYDDPTVLVVSIHCDPNLEYPFNSGYEDQIGVGEGVGGTLFVPLEGGTTWNGEQKKSGNGDTVNERTCYKTALEKAMTAILQYNVSGLVISLGLDTHDNDSVAVPGAGFKLSGKDYYEMGHCIGRFLKNGNNGGTNSVVPTVFVQEGGYKMDTVGKAATAVVGGFAFGAGGT